MVNIVSAINKPFIFERNLESWENPHKAVIKKYRDVIHPKIGIFKFLSKVRTYHVVHFHFEV